MHTLPWHVGHWCHVNTAAITLWKLSSNIQIWAACNLMLYNFGCFLAAIVTGLVWDFHCCWVSFAFDRYAIASVLRMYTYQHTHPLIILGNPKDVCDNCCMCDLVGICNCSQAAEFPILWVLPTIWRAVDWLQTPQVSHNWSASDDSASAGIMSKALEVQLCPRSLQRMSHRPTGCQSAADVWCLTTTLNLFKLLEPWMRISGISIAQYIMNISWLFVHREAQYIYLTLVFCLTNAQHVCQIWYSTIQMSDDLQYSAQGLVDISSTLCACPTLVEKGTETKGYTL